MKIKRAYVDFDPIYNSSDGLVVLDDGALIQINEPLPHSILKQIEEFYLTEARKIVSEAA